MTDTLIHRMRAHAAQAPNRECIRYLEPQSVDVVLTRQGFIRASEGVAELLEGANVSAGDLVLIILEDLPILTTTFIGTMLLGARPALLPFATEKLHPDRYQASIGSLIKIARPALLVTQEKLQASVRSVVESLEDISLPIFVVPDTLVTPSESYSLADRTYDPDDIALVQHSSGTTGLQKGVALTHRAVAANIDCVAQGTGYGDDEINVSWLPLYHDLGLIASFLLPLATGTRTVLIPTFYWLRAPHVLLKAMSDQRGTMCWMPNFAFNYCAMKIRKEDMQGLNLSSMRAFFNAGEPLYADSFEMFLAAFEPFGLKPETMCAGYGMAEVVLGISGSKIGTGARIDTVDQMALIHDGAARPVAPSDERMRAVISCGALLPGISLEVRDEQGGTLPERAVGEIAVCCDYVLREYYNRPDLGEVLQDGWLVTGDIGYMADDELYLIGRKKDFIIVGGKNIYPSDIETIISQTEGVYPGRVAVVGIPNGATGTEDIGTIIELLPEYESDPQAVANAVRRSVGQRSDVMLRHVWVQPHGWLIKSSSGKIARSANREKMREALGIADWRQWDGKPVG